MLSKWILLFISELLQLFRAYGDNFRDKENENAALNVHDVEIASHWRGDKHTICAPVPVRSSFCKKLSKNQLDNGNVEWDGEKGKGDEGRIVWRW